jgi:hypothetical protein
MIRIGKFGTKCSLYGRFEWENMAESAVYTDDSNGSNLAQSAVYTHDSNGGLWHKVQFIRTIRMEDYGTKCRLYGRFEWKQYGTKCSLYGRFEWENMAQSAVYTDDSNGGLWHKVQVQFIETKDSLQNFLAVNQDSWNMPHPTA